MVIGGIIGIEAVAAIRIALQQQMLVQIEPMGAQPQIDAYIHDADASISPRSHEEVVPEVMLVANVDGYVGTLGRHKGIECTQTALIWIRVMAGIA